ncbi:hypothetical protein E2C01_068735 [Portunus trituberculatus]|uniref:Uncharacterized protein n=1 Tax=Portunus trituberculatus TaxID=210409 RepID=A0A5B7HYP6_PORTR|nr:hypothetical protein [Portunus trituberculatus]
MRPSTEGVNRLDINISKAVFLVLVILYHDLRSSNKRTTSRTCQIIPVAFENSLSWRAKQPRTRASISLSFGAFHFPFLISPFTSYRPFPASLPPCLHSIASLLLPYAVPGYAVALGLL